MKRTLLLALFPLAVLAPASSSHVATAPFPESIVGVLAATIVHQDHGPVSRFEMYCGYAVTVSGVPGTRYRVVTTPAGGLPQVLTIGIVPAGGFLTTAVQAPDCTPQGAVERVQITSDATDVIEVEVEYH